MPIMAALPKGLVSNTEHISSELRKFACVDVLDVAKLWRSKLPIGQFQNSERKKPRFLTRETHCISLQHSQSNPSRRHWQTVGKFALEDMGQRIHKSYYSRRHPCQLVRLHIRGKRCPECWLWSNERSTQTGSGSEHSADVTRT